LVQEWDESVFDVILSELEMVSWERHKLDLTSLIESFDTDVVVLVEISGIQRKDGLAIFI